MEEEEAVMVAIIMITDSTEAEVVLRTGTVIVADTTKGRKSPKTIDLQLRNCLKTRVIPLGSAVGEDSFLHRKKVALLIKTEALVEAPASIQVDQ